MFRLKTNNFAVLAEETIDETTHIEQHRPQSYTIGDAIDIAVKRSHAQRQNPKSNEQGQEKHQRSRY